MHSRRNDRFLAPSDVHVTINPQSGAIPGFLIDISPKGAGIEYIPYTGPLKPNHNIEIIFEDENLGIDKLPCKTIYDFETEEEYNSPVQFRKVGVQFQGLTDRELQDTLFLIQRGLRGRDKGA